MTATRSDICRQGGWAHCPRCLEVIEAEDIGKFCLAVGEPETDNEGYVIGEYAEENSLKNSCPHCQTYLLHWQNIDDNDYHIQIIRSPADLKYLEMRGELV